MKLVVQLDHAGYFAGLAEADESPLEPGVYLLPAMAIDVSPPEIPDGQRARWEGRWVFEPIPVQVETVESNNTGSIEVSIRSTRDALLSKSDWTQLNDSPVDRNAWAIYRQALRDLPQQSGFPHRLVWPTPPTNLS